MRKLAVALALACALPLSIGAAEAQHHGSFGGHGGWGGHGGGWHGHGGWYGGVYFGGPYYDPFWGPYYPYYYDSDYYGAADYPPPGYAGPAPAAQSWYYCGDPRGYYPYVQSCKGPWQAVPASPPPAAAGGPPSAQGAPQPLQQGQ